jgi:DNA polymerase-3 subunit delta'
MNNTPTTPPAQLWIGTHQQLLATTIEYLQKQFCQQAGCSVCHTCHAIRNQQYYAVTWLSPEKQYSLEQLEVITTTMAFSLDSGVSHFFIIQQADALTPTCSNSLLKSIEEPPPGYHFILLTRRPDDLLLTVRSRCVETRFSHEEDAPEHKNLFAIFCTTASMNPAHFLKELELAKINELESIELLDQLLTHWIKTAHHAIARNDQVAHQQAVSIIGHLKKAILMPPMPGSSNLLWKNLFLQIKM